MDTRFKRTSLLFIVSTAFLFLQSCEKEDSTTGIEPEADFIADETTIPEGATVNFEDKSTGNPSNWQWDFGDGNTSSEQNPSHTYQEEGVYDVKLTVTNDYGEDTKIKEEYIKVGEEPTADFSVDEIEVEEGTTVNFTDKSTGDPTEWEWDFGDGNTSTEQNPSHTYADAGTYDVKLVVSNDFGQDTLIKTEYITVLGPPEADFSADETEVREGTTVNFTDKSTGYPTEWKWYFGDGSTSTKQNPSHTYTDVGAYDVRLEVSNDYGEDAEYKMDYIEVIDKKLKWRFETDGGVTSSPAIGSDGTIYVGSYDGHLYAINPDGTEKWRVRTGREVGSSPAIGSDGTIYVGSFDNYLHAINPDGTSKWRVETGDRIYSAPAIGSDGTIYLGSWDNYLYAVNPDGTIKWRFKTDDGVYSPPAINSDGTVYLGSYDNYLYAINPNGTEKWRYETGREVDSSPAIDSDGNVYFGSSDRNLYAINPDGTEKWRVGRGFGRHSSPAIASDGTIYFGKHDNNLYAINPDGTEKWRVEIDDRIQSSPAIDSDGNVYFGSHDNYLYAINPDGTEKWRFEAGDRILSSPAIDSDGTIYVGSSDGYLYAIDGGDIELGDTPWPKFRQNLKNTGRQQED